MMQTKGSQGVWTESHGRGVTGPLYSQSCDPVVMQMTYELKSKTGCGVFCANVNRSNEIEEDNCYLIRCWQQD